MADQDPIDRLLSQLMTSGLQIKDNPLFQVISQLIKYLRQLQTDTAASLTIINNNAGASANLTYATITDETGLLPFSRMLAAGTGITFDVSVPGVLTINSSGAGDQWAVLSNGDPINPEVIFADGVVVMINY